MEECYALYVPDSPSTQVLEPLAASACLTAHELGALSATARGHCRALGALGVAVSLLRHFLAGLPVLRNFEVEIAERRRLAGEAAEGARSRLLACTRLDVWRIKKELPATFRRGALIPPSPAGAVWEAVCLLVHGHIPEPERLRQLADEGRIVGQAAAWAASTAPPARAELFLAAMNRDARLIAFAENLDGAIGALAAWLQVASRELRELRELTELHQTKEAARAFLVPLARWAMRPHGGSLPGCAVPPPPELCDRDGASRCLALRPASAPSPVAALPAPTPSKRLQALPRPPPQPRPAPAALLIPPSLRAVRSRYGQPPPPPPLAAEKPRPEAAGQPGEWEAAGMGSEADSPDPSTAPGSSPCASTTSSSLQCGPSPRSAVEGFEHEEPLTPPYLRDAGVRLSAIEEAPGQDVLHLAGVVLDKQAPGSTRAAAVAALAAADRRKTLTLPVLMRVLCDRREACTLRVAAAEALGDLRPDEVGDSFGGAPLAAVVGDNFEDPAVREAAACMLGKLAARMLGKLGPAAALTGPALHRMLVGEQVADASAKCFAADALGRLGAAALGPAGIQVESTPRPAGRAGGALPVGHGASAAMVLKANRLRGSIMSRSTASTEGRKDPAAACAWSTSDFSEVSTALAD